MSIMDKEGHHYQLATDLTICRIVNGMWQVAGGHGYIDHKLAIEDMTWRLAKGTIKEYVTEHLPEQYQVCLTAFDTILKHAFDILETS
jgi:hypothetical protein